MEQQNSTVLLSPVPSVFTGGTGPSSADVLGGPAPNDIRADASTELGGRPRTSNDATDPGFRDEYALPAFTDLAPRARSARFSVWSRRYMACVIGLDMLVGLVAVAVSLWGGPFNFSPAKNAILMAAAPLLWPIAIASTRGYDRTRVGVGGDEMRAVARAGGLAIIIGAFPAGLMNRIGLLTLGVVAVPIAVCLSVATRFVARKVLHALQRRGKSVRSVLVVGSAAGAADLSRMLAHEPHSGISVLGVCVPSAEVDWARRLGLNVLGSLESVAGIVSRIGCDAVAVTSGEATRHNYLRELAWSLEGHNVELLVHPGLIEVAGPRMHIRPHVGLPLLYVEQPKFKGWRRVVKRATDLTLTGVGLLVISPVMLGIAAAIKLTDGGPVFFRQTRVGLDGSTFTMWKFRSMHTDAEERLVELRAQQPEMGLMFKMVDDPRITRVGKLLRKFSLDELPQLFNVLSGTMSLVGPRPPLQSEVDGYANDARRRLLVTPGLTGLWQVSGRSLLSWEETVRLDLRYVENWTLTFDLLILWKTVFAVAAKRGAF
ncbi:MAG: putative glycosyltransferase [Propionibacteriaceae bacterium]|jgi:exopolysaccharide biosynthesis polyprenyl glycosylphosphotransferase|nr:putative glycosyltransferase [Propionibacteriaceae bacterium]